jgi:AraC family transcriptional regulator of adaptative response/methylated-DNA-[protein]-cysteine methyltransferase
MDRNIVWTLRATRLGLLGVAATSRGVCHVTFADDEAGLARALAAEFPYAVLQRNDAAAGALATQLVDYVEGHRTTLDVPLDVGGSRFQRRVWDALRAIPRGQTRRYAEVAAALGVPGAARAVASACAANPVAVVVPCHRVVPAAGGAGGYRYGAWRKRALLAVEAGDAAALEAVATEAGRAAPRVPR